MLKKPARFVLTSFRSSTYRLRFSEGGIAGGVFPFAKIHCMGERHHEVGRYLLQAFTRCGLAGRDF